MGHVHATSTFTYRVWGKTAYYLQENKHGYIRLECKILMNLKTKQDVTKNFDACGRLCQITPRYSSCIFILLCHFGGEVLEDWYASWEVREKRTVSP